MILSKFLNLWNFFYSKIPGSAERCPSADES
jgi:hypothetical protein